MNLVEYLKKATDYLERHDVPSPRLNSEVLLANQLGISRLDIYTGFERVLTDGEAKAYRDLLARRVSGWPLQYLTAEAGFRGMVLEAAPGVLIPRPETEVLVEKALEVIPLVGPEVLDLGCGCGNIALSIAAERDGARVTAVDCEPAAIELTRRNAARTGQDEKIKVLEGDLFAPVEGNGKVFDAVVSNPPYVPDGCADSLPPEVTEHEPPRALYAGPDGLDVIQRIVAEAPDHLRQDGWLVLEVDENHAEEVIRLLVPPAPTSEGQAAGEAVSRWSDVELFEDLAGKPRVIRARYSGRGR